LIEKLEFLLHRDKLGLAFFDQPVRALRIKQKSNKPVLFCGIEWVTVMVLFVSGLVGIRGDETYRATGHLSQRVSKLSSIVAGAPFPGRDHLRPLDHSWFDLVKERTGDPARRGADYRQFATQHIEELRKFINASLTQNSTNPRYAPRRIAVSAPGHQSKFKELNSSIAMPEFGLANENWTVRVEFNCHRGN
jgi:hypothetical protein